MKFEVSSDLDITPEDIAGMLTMEGVNRELSPLIRMTVPPEWSGKAIPEWPTGKVLFSSWILLFGILPVDRHNFMMRCVDHQRGFVESSSSLINKLWRHRREIEDCGASYRVVDSIDFRCRLPLLEYILGPVYRFVFKHRHQVLRSYGESRCG